MEAIYIVGILLALVVAFFAYHWYVRTSSKNAGGVRKNGSRVNRAASPAEPASATVAPVSSDATAAPESLPQVSGQTEADLTAKEPIQRRNDPPQQLGIGADAQAPANFHDNLRHPEQLFHQPSGPAAVPSMTISDVPGGRAAMTSTPLDGNQQQFGPESAQNGGAFIGNSVFAFDGMEPTEFTAF